MMEKAEIKLENREPEIRVPENREPEIREAENRRTRNQNDAEFDFLTSHKSQ